MKKHILLSLVFLGAVSALQGQATLERELPRTRTLSYNSEAAALSEDVASSLYLQRLQQWTQTTDREGNTVLSTTYKMPFLWIDRQQFLRIEGISGSYSVAINGQQVAGNHSGRTAAEFNVTALTREGLNTAEITIYATHEDGILSSGGGTPRITGDAYIVSQPGVRIRDFVAEVNLEGDNTAIELGVVVKTHLLNPKDVRVHYALIAPDGSTSSYGHRDATLQMRGEDTVRFFVVVPDARPWSHEAPNLYTLVLRLQQERRYTEYVAYRIGLRTADVRDGKFRINGFEIPLCIADYGGGEYDPQVMERDLRRLKSEGVNTIKVVGHPQSHYFYELCDRIGLYVCNQADIDTSAGGSSRKVGGNPSNDPQWEQIYVDRAMTMYYTSQNHPSVVMFSPADNSANGYNLYESYLALKGVERRRPVVYTGAGGEWNTDAVDSNVTGVAAAGRFVFDKGLPAVEQLSGFAEISVVDGARAEFSITNRYTARPLAPAEIVWEVKQGNSTVGQGTQYINVAAGNRQPFQISYDRAKAGRPLSVRFTVYRGAEAFEVESASGASSSRNPLQRLTQRNSDNSSRIKIAEQSFEVAY